MTTFDKVKHMVGAAATGVLITGLSGGIAVPAWLMIAAAAIQFATGSTSAPLNSLLPGKKDARGQIADKEDPK